MKSIIVHFQHLEVYRLLKRLILLLSIIFAPPIIATGPVSAEYKVKAALIYKFTRFIEWPETTSTKNFGICVLGRDDFGNSLDALAQRKVHEKNIVIHRIKQSGTVKQQCQLVFISDSKQAFLGSLIKSFSSRPILTIGDSKEFAETGGMIQFTRGTKRIGFKINLQRAKAAQLSIAAPLLELATIVETGK